MRCIEIFTKFGGPNSQGHPMFAILIPIPVRDLYVWVIKIYRDLTMLVDEARKQAEEARDLVPLARLLTI